MSITCQHNHVQNHPYANNSRCKYVCYVCQLSNSDMKKVGFELFGFQAAEEKLDHPFSGLYGVNTFQTYLTQYKFLQNAHVLPQTTLYKKNCLHPAKNLQVQLYIIQNTIDPAEINNYCQKELLPSQNLVNFDETNQ